MNNEKLEKGKVISGNIEKLEAKAQLWETSIEFSGGIRILRVAKNASKEYVDAPTEHIPFEIVKALVLNAYTKQLEVLRAEFAAL